MRAHPVPACLLPLLLVAGCATTEPGWRHNALPEAEAAKRLSTDRRACVAVADELVGSRPATGGPAGAGIAVTGGTSPEVTRAGPPPQMERDRAEAHKLAYDNAFKSCMAQRGWVQDPTR